MAQFNGNSPFHTDNSLEKWKFHFQDPLAEYFPRIGRQGLFLGHKTAGNPNFSFDFQQRKSQSRDLAIQRRFPGFFLFFYFSFFFKSQFCIFHWSRRSDPGYPELRSNDSLSWNSNGTSCLIFFYHIRPSKLCSPLYRFF